HGPRAHGPPHEDDSGRQRVGPVPAAQSISRGGSARSQFARDEPGSSIETQLRDPLNFAVGSARRHFRYVGSGTDPGVVLAFAPTLVHTSRALTSASLHWPS